MGIQPGLDFLDLVERPGHRCPQIRGALTLINAPDSVQLDSKVFGDFVRSLASPPNCILASLLPVEIANRISADDRNGFLWIVDTNEVLQTLIGRRGECSGCSTCSDAANVSVAIVVSLMRSGASSSSR